jgi:small subunit ribosomal protein S15e
LFNCSDLDKEEDLPEVSIHSIIEIKHRYNRLYLKCKKAKKNTQPGEKPAPVKTHLRDAIIMPEMVGNFVSVYNGKSFNPV